MKVLSVFLKIIGIFVIVAGTIICAAIAISADMVEAYLVMSIAEACVIIVGLTILGLGSACNRISSLERRVAQLERRGTVVSQTAVPSASAHPASVSTAPLIEKPATSVPLSPAPTVTPHGMPREMAPDTSNYTPAPQKRKTRVWIPIVIVAAVILIAACVLIFLFLGSIAEPEEPEVLGVEDAYMQLLEHSANGEYLEAWRLGVNYPELNEYEDAQSYLDYCAGMRAFEAGGIGEAYNILRTVPHILDAQYALDLIDEKIGFLNGCYVADNGMGAYLHLVIRDGLVASKIIGYFDENQSFDYTDEDFYKEIVLSNYNDGTQFIAIGNYSSLGEEITVNYVINSFDDTSDIMVLAYEGNEFTDFNGMYTRTGDVNAWEPDDGYEDLSIGDSLVTDFFTMSFDDYVVAADVKHSVTTGYVTRITGPEPQPGQKYICLTGTIQNTSTAPLPVYDFFLGNFELDGYNYEVDANDIDILDGEGQTESEIAPLITYNYRLYVAIPDALADSYASCRFTFGFFDGFENQELAYIRSFEDDPISLCPYRYGVVLK